MAYLLSEDGVSISIITVDTSINHAVPLGLAVVIHILVEGKVCVSSGTLVSYIVGFRRTTLISNVFASFLGT
jgi:hypothetical protein